MTDASARLREQVQDAEHLVRAQGQLLRGLASRLEEAGLDEEASRARRVAERLRGQAQALVEQRQAWWAQVGPPEPPRPHVTRRPSQELPAVTRPVADADPDEDTVPLGLSPAPPRRR